MKRSKKIFLIVAILFVVAVLVISYDIATKTSFPGSKSYMEESIIDDKEEDTITSKEEEIGREEER